MLAHLTAFGRPVAVAIVTLFLIVGAVAAGDALLGSGSTVNTPSGPGAFTNNAPGEPDESAEPTESPEPTESAEPTESPEAADDDGDNSGPGSDEDDDNSGHDGDDDNSGPGDGDEPNDDNSGPGGGNSGPG